jgi:GTPase SAR1 family protein
MKLRNLPIGVQTFKKMRELNYVYVDKTQHVYNLAINEGAYFLSRPRRFGKSLLISTFKELFQGNRALFKGLWIEDKWDWAKTSPIIHLSFARLNYQGLGLAQAIQNELTELGQKHNIILTKTDFKDQFEELIETLFEQQGKVVILIDEYDKPIIDYLEKIKLDQAKVNQTIMKTFYSVLKDAEDYIQMLFITGVSKFSKVSIFSDLNHLSDLTLDLNYATITGYTQIEFEENFDAHIGDVAKTLNINREQLLVLMKVWYDGFSWDGKNFLYNPFGTLTFLAKKAFGNYWFATGTPTFLVKLMKEKSLFDFEKRAVNELFLEKYDLDNLDLVPLLFQTGYLTIKERDFMTSDLVLDYPNREVKDGMYQFLIDDLAKDKEGETSNITVKDLSRAFRENNLLKVRDIIDTLFGDLPYNLYERQAKKKDEDADAKSLERLSERFFHGLIHLIFKYLGIHIDSEVHTAKRRADSIVQTATHVYIFEFKFNKTAEEAIKQLQDKGYAQKFKALGKTIIGIGVNFSRKERQIDGWLEMQF